MNVIYSKGYLKRFLKLTPKQRQKVMETIELFQSDPFHPRLHNHSLKGALTPGRAISVTHDMRIIFIERNNHSLVTLIDIGTHNRVY